jgi:DNA-binding transcriptional MerR regulator
VTVKINGQTYYRTIEACRRAGISRATLFRWLKSGILEKSIKDRNGWRLYTEQDLDTLKNEAQRIEIN